MQDDRSRIQAAMIKIDHTKVIIDTAKNYLFELKYCELPAEVFRKRSEGL